MKTYPTGRIFIPDSRDRLFPMRALIPENNRQLWARRRYYNAGSVLNQMEVRCPFEDTRHPYCTEQGFCVGAAWKQWWQSAPLMTPHSMNMLGIYHRAQANDEWDGGAESYSGSSVRGGAKALKALGIVESYHWARTLDDVLDWLLMDLGTIVAGTNWTVDMFTPDRDGYIHPTGYLAGGHAYLIVGASMTRRALRILNSWSRSWGQNGRAWISFADFAALLADNGEACAAVEAKSGG